MSFRQPQQRQAAIAMARAQDFERPFGTGQRIVQSLFGDAVRPDVSFKGAFNRLMDRHGLSAVMPGLVPGIHAFVQLSKTWMAGTSPAMTNVGNATGAMAESVPVTRFRSSSDPSA